MCLGGISTEEQTAPPQTQKSMDEIEQEVWTFMAPAAWHDSVAKKESIFRVTYEETRRQIAEMAVRCNHDVIIEVGSGTGDIVGLIDSSAIEQGRHDMELDALTEHQCVAEVDIADVDQVLRVRHHAMGGRLDDSAQHRPGVKQAVSQNQRPQVSPGQHVDQAHQGQR